MALTKKIRVLVVDDSLVFQQALARGIARDPSIEVVGTASDPYAARDLIVEKEPDVLTLDVEMPKMSGIEFLKYLMPQYPLPVVMVSAVNDNVFDALNAGAVDFVCKPGSNQNISMDGFINELVIKIKIASTARMGKFKHTSGPHHVQPSGSQQERYIAVGASTGGTEALYHMLEDFPQDCPGTVIVQHMPPVFTKMYADRLNNSLSMEVCEAKTGDEIRRGRVLIAPGDRQMRVIRRNGVFQVECFEGERVNGHCPSVDVLFDSVAGQMKDRAIGVILTGMGYDGARGLLKMRQTGSFTVGQDEATSVVYGMPRVAYEMGAVAMQVPLNQVAQEVFTHLSGRR